MTKEEVLYHWNYFCSLCERLGKTRSYVDHSTLTTGVDQAGNNITINNGDVFSNEFQQILILSGVEFEDAAKLLCQLKDQHFNM